MIITLSISILSLLTGPREVACSCVTENIAEDRKISKSYTKASLVLVGKVVKAEPVNPTEARRPGQDSTLTVPLEQIRYTFAVTQLVKGEGVGKTIEISSPAQSAACGVNFTVGIEYLVYAYTASAPAASKAPPRYLIGLCSRHQELRAVKSAELRQLRRIAQKASGEPKVTWFELGD